MTIRDPRTETGRRVLVDAQRWGQIGYFGEVEMPVNILKLQNAICSIEDDCFADGRADMVEELQKDLALRSLLFGGDPISASVVGYGDGPTRRKIHEDKSAFGRSPFEEVMT